MFVAPAGGAGALVAAAVSSITTTVEAGLYSPWTLEGSIIVDGVAASTHTAWWVAPAPTACFPCHARQGCEHSASSDLACAMALPAAPWQPTMPSPCTHCRPGELSALALVPAQHVRSAQGALAAAHAAVQAPLRAAFRLLGPAPLAALDAVIYQLMSSGVSGTAAAVTGAVVAATAVGASASACPKAAAVKLA